MSKRLNTSLYWWIIVLVLLTGCTQNILPDETTLSASQSTEIVTPQVEFEDTVLEPTFVKTTMPMPDEQRTANCKKIAFSEYDGLNYDIYTVCPDGTQLVNLTNDASDDVDPAWSPDGTKIAFSSTRSGHFQIYIMSEYGEDVIALTSELENLKPVWLPDGKHIAFRTDDGKGLYWWRVINIENLELTQISEPSYDFFYQTPAWSPDGKRIAYMSLVEQQERNDGSSQIHVKNVDGTMDIALTHDAWANFNPKWSPDGTRIAFLSERGGSYEMFALYIMNADGTEVQQITDTGYPADVVFSWSPDGKQIVIGNNNLFSGISIIDIETKNLQPLMEWSFPANVAFPTWQP